MSLSRVVVALSLGLASANIAAAGQPKVVRDVFWVWRNPEMAKPGEHTPATFASAGPAKRAELLGVPNVILAGDGIPNDDQKAEALTHEAAPAARLVWEIGADGGGGPPFAYTKRVAQVRNLVGKYPQIEGVLLDDMSTVAISGRGTPKISSTWRRTSSTASDDIRANSSCWDSISKITATGDGCLWNRASFSNMPPGMTQGMPRISLFCSGVSRPSPNTLESR